jgi:hypothetical protein
MHPKVVQLLVRRAAALVVVLAIGAAGWAECAGWQATAEARMACCSGTGPCPMHGSTAPVSGARMAVTQAQADSCCAASGTEDATPSTGAFSLALSTALVRSALSIMAPVTVARASFDGWPAHVPLAVGQVPTHLLLSVFLI